MVKSLKHSAADVHFYIDNAPPKEVVEVLRVLSTDVDLSLAETAEMLWVNYGFRMQRDRTYSPRRLLDLGLSVRNQRKTGVRYRLNERGSTVQNILNADPAFALDLLHYLHYTGYRKRSQDRKYLWSYRTCCRIIWAKDGAVSTSQLASEVQVRMREEFRNLDYGARAGARFNGAAAGCVYTWLRALDPSPLQDGTGKPLIPREVDRPELALLALDDTYRARGYTYGDPVVMDDNLIDQIAGVFFLDSECCRNLLRIAARITRSLRFADTLGGASINLLKPYGIENL